MEFVRSWCAGVWIGVTVFVLRHLLSAVCRLFGRPGDDLLSRVLRRSTIGAEGFHDRVRNGIGCRPLAMVTRSSGQTTVDGRQRTEWF